MSFWKAMGEIMHLDLLIEDDVPGKLATGKVLEWKSGRVAIETKLDLTMLGRIISLKS